MRIGKQVRLAILCVIASGVLSSVSRAQVPVFAFAKEDSSIKFSVKASVSLEGTFDKWGHPDVSI